MLAAVAGALGVTGSVTGLITWAAYYISYLIATIGMFIFGIEVFFLQFLLDLNYNIVNSPSVQFGFSIVLAFANILFVAAIIIMAVATIVRYNTYGARQLLVKIVVAAIGVNFSLILAGTVISFADQGTKFFMNNAVVNPTSDTGVSGFGSGGFVDNLAGAFNPQRMMIQGGIETDTGDKKEPAEPVDPAKALAKQGGTIYSTIAGIVMTAGMVILLAIFFGVLVAAFLIRFIMLSLLLTIMPVVWLAWIFPFGQSLVKYWTDKFVKWTFFAPMAMFFLYLSMKSVSFLNSAHILDNKNIAALNGPVGDGKGVSGFLFKVFGTFAAPLITNMLNFTLVAGTLYGGLYFSSKLGIKAAGAGAKAFESLGTSVKRRAITAVKDRGLSTWDRARTAGKNADGVSAVSRFGSRLATGGGRFGSALRTGAGVFGIPVEKAGLAIAKQGKLDPKDKDYKARIKREKDALSGLDNEALHVLRERAAAKSITTSPEKDAALYEMLKDRKQLGEITKRIEAKKEADEKDIDKRIKEDKEKDVSRSTSINADQQEADNREYYRKTKPDYEKQLEAQLGKLADAGVLGDFTAAAPQLAALAPSKKKKDGTFMTPGEMVADAVSGLKRDDVPSIAFSINMFGDPDGDKKPTMDQIRNVLALNAMHFNEISVLNPEAAEAIVKTAKWLEKPPKEWAEANLHEPDKVDAATGEVTKGTRRNWSERAVHARANALINLNLKGPNTNSEKAAKAGDEDAVKVMQDAQVGDAKS